MASLGENIKKARERKRLTRRDLSKLMGLAEGSSTVADLEANRNPDVGVLKLLRAAKSLKTTVPELLRGVDPEYDALCDLVRQPSTGPSASKEHPQTQETPRNVVVEHGPATSALEDKIDQTRTQLEAIRDSLNTLVHDLADRGEPRKAKRHSAGARRLHR